MTTGGQGLALGVTSKSAHPEVAAAYLDFITDAKAADVMTADRRPARGAHRGRAVHREGRRRRAGRRLAAAQPGQRPGAVPRLLHAHVLRHPHRRAPGLIGGKDTAEEFTQTLQTDYEKFQQG